MKTHPVLVQSSFVVPALSEPFPSKTNIIYDMKEDALVTVNIFNILGYRVRSLVRDHQTAGYRAVHWDATDDFGQQVSSGIYFYQISVGNLLKTKKMLFLE